MSKLATKDDLKEALAKVKALQEQLEAQLKEKPVVEDKSEIKKLNRAPTTAKAFEEWFIRAPESELYNVRRGQWECCVGNSTDGTAHILVFHSALTTATTDGAHIVCVRPIGSKVAIFNGSRIAYGTSRQVQLEPQRIAEEAGAIPLPFASIVSTQNGAGLRLERLEVIAWKGAETIIVPMSNHRVWQQYMPEERHFAGAAVVKIDDKYFLFDADRNELEFHNFNPFFTELPGKATTVEEAYTLLKPREVIDAEAQGKRRVIRQGEFFFVECDSEDIKERILSTTLTRKAAFTDRVILNNLIDRILLLGAIQCNYANEYILRELAAATHKSMTDSNGDYLIPGPSKLKVRNVLNSYVTYLSKQYGVKEAAIAKEHRYPLASLLESVKSSPTAAVASNAYDSLPSEYDRCSPIERELYYRIGTVTTNYAIHPNEKRQPHLIGIDRRYGIRYNEYLKSNNLAIRGNAAQGDSNHHVTAIYQPREHEVYAIGKVSHMHKQHQQIYLPGFYRVYSNTAVRSWQVSGDVD